MGTLSGNLPASAAVLVAVVASAGCSPKAASTGNPAGACIIDCFGPPPACHYEGALTEGDDCSKLTCGRVVCPGPDGGGSAITLADGTALLGGAFALDIEGGTTPRVEARLEGDGPQSFWMLFATFDVGSFKTGNLVVSIGGPSTSAPGSASVEAWEATGVDSAASGTLTLARGASGIWSGAVATESAGLSATFLAAEALRCLVPAELLGATVTSGTDPVVPDTDFRTPFCAQFRP